MAGIDTWYGSALSENALDELDLSEMGHLLAVTANDELNTLVVQHYQHHFGGNRTFRLATASEGRGATGAQALSGRVLFDAKATHAFIEPQFARGHRVKTTRLTEQFDREAFHRLYGADALLLFSISENGILWPATVDRPLAPGPGHQVIALVDESRAAMAAAGHPEAAGQGPV